MCPKCGANCMSTTERDSKMWHCDSIQMVDRPFSQSPKCRINQLTAERDQWRERAERTEAVLRECEWGCHDGTDYVCVYCGYSKQEGHARSCLVGTALTASTGSQPCQQPLDK
jgi:hypothetical protein